MEILVASLLASMISKWEKLKFPFPPLMTKRSKSNPPQQSAELNSDKKYINKNSPLGTRAAKSKSAFPTSLEHHSCWSLLVVSKKLKM